MGYNNRYSLKVETPKIHLVKFCVKCNSVKTGKFCSTCGGKLIDKEVDFDLDKIDMVIDEFRNFSEEAGYMLNSQGGSEEGGSGYNMENDISKFSVRYPELLFVLHCDPDPGFDEPPYKQYHKGGLVHKAKTTVTFEKYDENKLQKFKSEYYL